MTSLVTRSAIDPALGGVARLLHLFDQAGVTRADLPTIDTREFDLRPMTVEERQGYLYALDVMQTWAAQLEASANKLSDNAEDAISRTPRQICVERVRMVGDLARAQQLGFVRG